MAAERHGGDTGPAGGPQAGRDDPRRGGPSVAAPLTAGSAAGKGVRRPGRRQEDDANLVAYAPLAGPVGGGDRGAGRRDEDDPNLVVAHALTAEGADANGDGTGRGVRSVAHALTARERKGPSTDANSGNLVAGTLRSHPRPGSASPGALVIRGGQTGVDGGEVPAGPAPAPGQAAPADPDTIPLLETRGRRGTPGTRDGLGIGRRGDPMFTLQASHQHGVATFRKATKAHGPDDAERWVGDDLTGTLDATGMGSRTAQAVAGGADADGTAEATVRRLTPRECERLQGLPDDWTAHGVGGRPQSDSARYHQLGNAVAVPVATWIARRLVAEHSHVAAGLTYLERGAAR